MRFHSVLSAIVTVLATLGAAHAESPLSRFTFDEPHMGTRFRIILYAPSEQTARKAATAAYARIAELDATMSDYRPASELMRLCAKSRRPSCSRQRRVVFRLVESPRNLAHFRRRPST